MDDEDQETTKRSRTTDWRRRQKARLENEDDGVVLVLNAMGQIEPQNVDVVQDMVQHEQLGPAVIIQHDDLDTNQDIGEDFELDSDSVSSDDLAMQTYEDPNDSLEANFLDHDDDSDSVDPVFGNESVSSNSSSSSEEEDDVNFNIQHDSLESPLQFAEPRSVKESLILYLALSVRYNSTYESLIQTFQPKNILFKTKFFPTSKKELWRLLGRNESGIVQHVYCSDCGFYVGKMKKLAQVPQCKCSVTIDKSKCKYFITVSLRKQLQHFLSLPVAAEWLSYRERRKKSGDNTVENIFDGRTYRRLQQEKGLAENDFTCLFNTDGCKMSSNAKTSLYPVFVRLNELPPNLRQKFMFLAALFVDTEEPRMNTLFLPAVKEMNDLNQNGISWRTHGGEERVSRFFFHCFCVDGKARWQVLNMNSHSGYYGCTYCTIKGVRINNTMRFTAAPHPDVPPYEDRTDTGMRADMLAAKQSGNVVRGHKGVTALALVKNLDLAEGSAADDLHNLYECAVPVHVNLLLKIVPHRVNRDMGEEALCDMIDERLKKVKTPSCIARKPVTVSIKNRDQFKGTEWRNFLLYYGVPCFQGLIHQKYLKHFEMLSKFAYLLSLYVITEQDLAEADRLINEYLLKFEEYFGIGRRRLNMHALLHATTSVKNLGPYWAYSTFNFESWNSKIIQKVTSPKGVIMQVVLRHLIHMQLEIAVQADGDVSPDIKDQIRKIISKKKRSRPEQMADHVFLLGQAEQRVPTPEESQVLLRENFVTETLQVFPKILIN